ncbi:MAG: hypothetical protein ABR583_05565 [Gaiellaceae bacterium]
MQREPNRKNSQEWSTELAREQAGGGEDAGVLEQAAELLERGGFAPDDPRVERLRRALESR